MHLQIKIFFLLPFLHSVVSFSQGVWTQKADLPGMERQKAVGFSIGAKGYIGTGLEGATGPQKDFWEYDPSMNVWTQKSDFAGMSRYAALGFSIGGYGYLGFANCGNVDFWEYDSSADVWTQKANFAGSGDRVNAVGFAIGTKGYIGTGFGPCPTFSTYFNDFWEYDPSSNIWTMKNNFPGTGRHSAVGFSISNKGYIGTGTDGFNDFSDFWEYDSSGNLWTQKATYGGGVTRAAVGFCIGTKGYIGTGAGSVDTVSGGFEFWEYEPSTNFWTRKANYLGTAGYYNVGFSIGSKGYIGTGWASFVTEVKDFWEYDPNGIGIEEVKNADQIKVFPNPFHDRTNISIDSKINFPFDVLLMDLSGKEVQRISNLHSNNIQLSRENLPSGIYFLKVSDSNDENIFIKKVIIN